MSYTDKERKEDEVFDSKRTDNRTIGENRAS